MAVGNSPGALGKQKPVATPGKSHRSQITHPNGTDPIRYNVHTIFTILKLYGYHPLPRDEESTVERYRLLTAALQGNWIQVFKYKTAAFYGIKKKNANLPKSPLPPPIQDNPNFLVNGRAARFIELFPRKYGEIKFASLLASLREAKKGMERPGPRYLGEAAEEFYHELTAPQPPETWAERDTRVDIEVQLRRTVREIFDPIRQERAKKSRSQRAYEQALRETKPFFPSTSANYINSRAEAGSVGAMLEHPRIQKLRVPGGPLHLQRSGGHEEKREQESEEESPFTSHHNKESFTDAMASLWRECCDIALTEPSMAVPVPLSEPLKVRVITKMAPFKSYVLQHVQRELHSALRRLPMFKLIGDPRGGEASFELYLEKQLKMKLPLRADEVFVSGDYKKATDRMKKWASETVAEEICNVLGYNTTIRKLFLELLTGNTIELGDLPPLTQTLGQLMGSIVSFPVLCIINAAVSRRSLEKGERKTFPLEDCPMVVNGDDILFRSGPDGVNEWRTDVAEVGMEESIGKTYFSRNFVQINSTDFTVEGERFIRVPYVNMGLITGKKRTGGVRTLYNADGDWTLGAQYREMIKSCPPNMEEAVHYEFVKNNKQTLDSTILPWHIPEWAGGLGLIGVKNPSILDRRIVGRVLRQWKVRRPLSLGASPVFWKTWEKATSRLPDPIHVKQLNEGVNIYKDAVCREALNLILDSNVPLNQLKLDEERGQDFVVKRIRHNEKLWSTKTNNFPPPVSLEQLRTIRRYESTRETTVREQEVRKSLLESMDFEVKLDYSEDEEWPTPVQSELAIGNPRFNIEVEEDEKSQKEVLKLTQTNKITPTRKKNLLLRARFARNKEERTRNEGLSKAERRREQDEILDRERARE